MTACARTADGAPGFMEIQVKRLLERYFLTCTREDTCLEYFLWDVKTRDLVSLNLILSHDRFAGGIYISKFYPRLFLTGDGRFLSAACFYLMVHHSAGVFNLTDPCRVSLETEAAVFEEFYSRLADFHFRIARHRPGTHVCLSGTYHCLPIDRKIVTEK
ncbi:MAG TPA: hypothetical protein VK885_00400 [Desulfotignum sp.]|jgi:hypothetical protein|nr:hypothetical protein [Desulfotignum sp.]